LAPSGETAEAIGIAAVSECQNPRHFAEEAFGKCLPEGMVNKLLEHLDTAGRQIATTVVVEMRAARSVRK
jgi:hypothetical protein